MEAGTDFWWRALSLCHILHGFLQLVCAFVEVRALLAVLCIVSYYGVFCTVDVRSSVFAELSYTVECVCMYLSKVILQLVIQKGKCHKQQEFKPKGRFCTLHA